MRAHSIVRHEFLSEDRALADMLREANELRRSRCLPEYTVTDGELGALRRRTRRWSPCRVLRTR